jgi:putative ABC transport system permease protein
MRLSDYSKWVLDEIKETKTFTILNVLGVGLSVCVIILFLSLALGIEETTIKKITEEVELFTLEVDPLKQNKPLHYTDFLGLETDSRIKQIIPVLTEYTNLKVSLVSTTTKNQKPTLPIYTESYFINNLKKSDESLKIIAGKLLSSDDNLGIIIPEAIFKDLTLISPKLTKENFRHLTLEMDVTRYHANIKDLKSFKCQIVGIAKTTPHNGALVYIAFSLAQKIDDWVNFRTDPQTDYRYRDYERFDFVTNNLNDLESLRKEFQTKGYTTSSVLDRIDNVKKVLLIVKIIFFLIFSIAVLISGFNIVITLTSSVLKKKQEIGILKAIGASDTQIQYIFVFHAVYISFFGSILGTLTSYLVIILSRKILLFFDNLKDFDLFKIDIGYIVIIIISSLLLSILASLIPARRAASITPIETIREL